MKKTENDGAAKKGMELKGASEGGSGKTHIRGQTRARAVAGDSRKAQGAQTEKKKKSKRWGGKETENSRKGGEGKKPCSAAGRKDW